MTTQATPEQAREIAQHLFFPNGDNGYALRSLAEQVEALTAERDIAVRKLAALSNAHALEDLYLVGLVQEREITLLTKERDVLTIANRDLQDWFDALKTDHDALKDAALLALVALDAVEIDEKHYLTKCSKAIAALKAVL